MGFDYALDEDTIRCDCGHVFTAYLYDRVYNDAIDSGYSFKTKEVQCPECKSNYTLSLDISISIDEEYDIQKTSDATQPLYQLETKLIGDAVDLEDGTYIYGNYSYVINNGILDYKYGIQTDENQMLLNI